MLRNTIYLHLQGNFNSLMGIITGLNMTPVSRLRRTWSKIQAAGKFAVLEHQVNAG
jgi:hypothetical protein